MTVTLDEMAKRKPVEVSAEQAAATELVRLAKEQGLSLIGPEGLLKLLTKSVIETALSEEMTDHLGYEKHDPAGVGAENIRSGTRSKTVISGNTGPVEIDVPRDRAGTFDPPIVTKRQRRLREVDETDHRSRTGVGRPTLESLSLLPGWTVQRIMARVAARRNGRA
jgi:putative transposase